VRDDAEVVGSGEGHVCRRAGKHVGEGVALESMLGSIFSAIFAKFRRFS
jgi:hypothetical protein